MPYLMASLANHFKIRRSAVTALLRTGQARTIQLPAYCFWTDETLLQLRTGTGSCCFQKLDGMAGVEQDERRTRTFKSQRVAHAYLLHAALFLVTMDAVLC